MLTFKVGDILQVPRNQGRRQELLQVEVNDIQAQTQDLAQAQTGDLRFVPNRIYII